MRYHQIILILVLLLVPDTATAFTFTPVSKWVDALAVQNGHLWVGTMNALIAKSTTDESYEMYRGGNDLGFDCIRSLLVDSRNTVWAGTASGIKSFDGAQWTIHDPGFTVMEVSAIAEDHRGVLWFGTVNGIISYDRTAWTRIPEHYGGAEQCVFAVAVDLDDVKWFATNNGVLRFDGTAWTRYTSLDGLANDQVSSIAVDHNNVKWFGCRQYEDSDTGYTGGLSRFDGVSWKTYTMRDGLSYNGVLSIAVDNTNVLWIGTWNGLSRFDGVSWRTFTYPDGGLPNQAVTSLAVDNHNVVWVGTQEWIARFDGVLTPVVTVFEDIKISYINQIAVDLDNVKWFGSRLDGIASFDGKQWRNYPGEQDLGDYRVTSIAVGPDNVKWFATEYGGLVRYDNSTWRTFTTSNSGLLNNTVTSVEVDRDNVVWITIFQGVMSFDGVTWKLYPLPEEHSQEFDLIAVGPDNVKWFGTREGLVRFDGVNWERIRKGDYGFPGDTVGSLYMDRDGILWVGFIANPPLNPDWKEGDDPKDKYNWNGYDPEVNGVCCFDGVSFRSYRMKDGLIHWSVRASVKDGSGSVWFATHQGLSRFDGVSWKSYQYDLGGGIYYISAAVDRMNSLWFGGSGNVLVFENGAFKSMNGRITSVQDDHPESTAVPVIHNHPNPFNPFTTLTFTLPEPGTATLDVYDILGRKVRELMHGPLPAGNHTAVWNGLDSLGKRTSSGIYLAVLRAGQYTITRKMLLMR